MSAQLPHLAAGHALAAALVQIERNLERLGASEERLVGYVEGDAGVVV